VASDSLQTLMVFRLCLAN